MKVVSKRMGGARRRDDGAAGATADGAVQEKTLTAMVFKYQRKDTNLLCLDGCPSDADPTTVKPWDKDHPDVDPVWGDHGDMNCVRASIAMMVSFYGKDLSQDRIAYFTEEERAGVGDGIAEGDLAHSTGMVYSAPETAALEWALDENVDFHGTANTPTFADLRGWIDDDRPIMTRTPGHLRAMNGYRVDNANVEWVSILDPGTGQRWETFATWDGAAAGTWVGPASAPDAREDEPNIAVDSDRDGVYDFDEQLRFETGRYDRDSDNDDVPDKNDLREYVFDAADDYDKRTADFDADGVRKERDPDNDGDTFNDGGEDKNANGKYEPAAGETDNFDPASGFYTAPKPIHAVIIFDRSGSMSQKADPTNPSSLTKYEEATSAASLFLDTWLVTGVTADTKVGLVFYDHTAHFDTTTSTNTTLEPLTAAKRDKIVSSFTASANQPAYGSTSIGGGIVKSFEPDGFDVANVSADLQHRMIVVVTDGKENTGVRMDNPAVIQGLVDGEIDGHALGIGGETQINVEKLDALADILGHPPASLAKDMTDLEVEKFFVQALTETQGMEFTVDPVHTINMGATASHPVTVGPGAATAAFIVAWNARGAKLQFTLKGPNGQPVPADAIRTNTYYQVSAKKAPAAGDWTVVVSAQPSGAGTAPATVRYILMALEKNGQIATEFKLRAISRLAGDPLLLTATLSKKRRAVLRAEVAVEITKPRVGIGEFIAKARVDLTQRVRPLEGRVPLSPLETKLRLMGRQGLVRVPEIRTVVKLNDAGQGGDEIPGDGVYSAFFKDTGREGIYSFRFVARGKAEGLVREKTLSAHIRPRVSAKSLVQVVRREYRAATRDTFVVMRVTPVDEQAGMIGPGRAEWIDLAHEGAEVTSIKDRFDGTYDVEATIQGRSPKELKLRRLREPIKR